MTRDNNNPPAFPVSEYGNGMELRDYFAAAALTGLLPDLEQSWAETAKDAYKQADAMLAARKPSTPLESPS